MKRSNILNSSRIIMLLSISTLLTLPSVSRAKGKSTIIKVNTSACYQQIDSFGASDSWRCQFVGENWPLDKRNKIADLLFSLEFKDSGKPKGIGLSNWRFYLGAGSMEQGEQSDIKNEWRRAECFLDSNGDYDWQKHKGQRWFLQAAKDRSVPHFTIYPISPPSHLTKSGKTYASKGDRGFNLKPNCYDDYSKFLVDVIEHFNKNEGVEFDYVSPFNEPQWDWSKANQEGTPASNNDLYIFMRYLSNELSKRESNTKMLIGEAGQIDFLYQRNSSGIGDQVDTFFNPSSPLYIGDFNNLEHAISAHSYFTTWPLEKQIETRQKLAKKIEDIDPKLAYHQTEFCILEKNPEIEGGWKRDLGMATALYVARVIHSDLTIANAKSWEWWTALSQFNYKDGLIHLDDGLGVGVKDETSELNHKLKFDGHISETKLLWAFGNFSRFIRPGMFRVEASIDNNLSLEQQATNMQVSAYYNKHDKSTVIVIINHTNENKELEIEGLINTHAIQYITDKSRSLEAKETKLRRVTAPKRSVSTIVVEM